jgi:hypothetical protein
MPDLSREEVGWGIVAGIDGVLFLGLDNFSRMGLMDRFKTCDKDGSMDFRRFFRVTASSPIPFSDRWNRSEGNNEQPGDVGRTDL